MCVYKRPWCWERRRAGGGRVDREWDGWITSPMQWTWVWAHSRRYWRTAEPDALQFMGKQRVRQDLVTEQQILKLKSTVFPCDLICSLLTAYFTKQSSPCVLETYIFLLCTRNIHLQRSVILCLFKIETKSGKIVCLGNYMLVLILKCGIKILCHLPSGAVCGAEQLSLL